MMPPGITVRAAAAILEAARASTTQLALGGGVVVVRAPLAVDHDIAQAQAAEDLSAIRDGSHMLAKIGIVPPATEDMVNQFVGLSSLLVMGHLIARCVEKVDPMRDETGAPVTPDAAVWTALLMDAGLQDIAAVRTWAYAERNRWSAEGNGSGPPRSASGAAARSQGPASPITPEPASGSD